ncbi:hypothetical protein GMMP15_790007 [Candidatus Magnetomoraceae bacterium gMMP-15]
MSITLTCSNCNKSYSVNDNLAGKKVKCECGNIFKIPRSDLIHFTCDCGKKYVVNKKYAGKRVKCSSCEAIFKIPQSGLKEQLNHPETSDEVIDQTPDSKSQPEDDDSESKSEESSDSKSYHEDDDSESKSEESSDSKSHHENDDSESKSEESSDSKSQPEVFQLKNKIYDFFKTRIKIFALALIILVATFFSLYVIHKDTDKGLQTKLPVKTSAHIPPKNISKKAVLPAVKDTKKLPTKDKSVDSSATKPKKSDKEAIVKLKTKPEKKNL